MRAGLYISLVLMILYFNIGYVLIALGATLLTIFLDSQRETNEDSNHQQPLLHRFPSSRNSMYGLQKIIQ